MTTKAGAQVGQIPTKELQKLLGDQLVICRSARKTVKNPLYIRTNFGTFTPMGEAGQAFLERALKGEPLEADNDPEPPEPIEDDPAEELPEQTPQRSAWAKFWSDEDE